MGNINTGQSPGVLSSFGGLVYIDQDTYSLEII